jgi:hypothetical protein
VIGDQSLAEIQARLIVEAPGGIAEDGAGKSAAAFELEIG